MLFEKWDMKEALKVRESEGMARGMLMKQKETAMKMKAIGMSIDEIAEITGLFVDDILRL